MTEPDEDGQRPAHQRISLRITYELLLEAMRHREQEFLRYLAFLAPAVAGFFLLVVKPDIGADIFCGATLVLSGLLVAGAVYCIVLGYQYRCLTVEIARIEHALDITDYVLEIWPRSRTRFLDRLDQWRRLLRPPDVINFFFWVCVVATVGVALATAFWPIGDSKEVIQAGAAIVATTTARPGSVTLTVEGGATSTTTTTPDGQTSMKMTRTGAREVPRKDTGRVWHHYVCAVFELCLALCPFLVKWRYWDKFKDVCRNEPEVWPVIGAAPTGAPDSKCG